MKQIFYSFLCLSLAAFTFACSSMESYYEKGREAYKNGHYKTALRYFLPLAEKGHVNSQVNVGIMYAKGLGVEKDTQRAFYWIKRSAEGGYDEAQAMLADMYERGIGVRQNMEEAIKWYKKAAAQGYEGAKRYLEDLEKSR